ncbi:dihydrolipoyllysine-residue succinyltransferase component of 2-oxoglutarate dehydrogenase complex 2, mitochondrial isoform X1 [Eutrema salsugineum]|uniref:dihydrolipoyllysine-residue succinyltransferase component of 2-oxoglutarate dehydrogenase complex 2, mitochondrial isoform X1 n=1 Tax=Eutrema salsugineum TaxID=72664 RepID=UPI000CED0F93|nr:dihydrolipoyllysine-residue succinyltransferase component of 2-oxoglutarate dehydrogenase complex 2, mitochondrial isoform X1 [Eutrema salsugineum]
MVIWSIVRRKVVNGGNSSASSILEQSWKSTRATASHPRYYGAFAKETSLVARGSQMVNSLGGFRSYLGTPGDGQHLRKVSVPCIQTFNASIRLFSSDNGGSVDALVPFMGESISDGTLATFLKKPGDRVEADEPIAQIETDKVTIDVASPVAGTIEKLVAKEGDTVEPGFKIAVISQSSGAATQAKVSEKMPEETKSDKKEEKPKPVAEAPPSPKVETSPPKEKSRAPTPPASGPSPREPQLPPKDRERRVPMTRLRKRVATRLKDSQNTFALLTTFNEVDMTNLMKLRSEYKDAFLEKHGVKLGLMSGFIKGAISALQNQPVVNAVIDGEDIIYRDYVDISIAVGTPKGLVVPVLRNVEQMNFAEIEKEINKLAKKATAGTISIDEMAGGTFTISNGGVYGSLLSTPIINPPQSAILGMHSIVNRPMVVGGEVVSRPMMYIALTYDHRLIDGREAVLFLRRIKDVVEDPRRLLLDI